MFSDYHYHLSLSSPTHMILTPLPPLNTSATTNSPLPCMTLPTSLTDNATSSNYPYHLSLSSPPHMTQPTLHTSLTDNDFPHLLLLLQPQQTFPTSLNYIGFLLTLPLSLSFFLPTRMTPPPTTPVPWPLATSPHSTAPSPPLTSLTSYLQLF